jgi:hypothetical protein
VDHQTLRRFIARLMQGDEEIIHCQKSTDRSSGI